MLCNQTKTHSISCDNSQIHMKMYIVMVFISLQFLCKFISIFASNSLYGRPHVLFGKVPEFCGNLVNHVYSGPSLYFSLWVNFMPVWKVSTRTHALLPSHVGTILTSVHRGKIYRIPWILQILKYLTADTYLSKAVGDFMDTVIHFIYIPKSGT